MGLGSGTSPEGVCVYRVLCAAHFVLCTMPCAPCPVCAMFFVHHALMCTMP